MSKKTYDLILRFRGRNQILEWVNQIGMNTLRQDSEIKKEHSSAVNDKRSIISSHTHSSLRPALIAFHPRR